MGCGNINVVVKALPPACRICTCCTRTDFCECRVYLVDGSSHRPCPPRQGSAHPASSSSEQTGSTHIIRRSTSVQATCKQLERSSFTRHWSYAWISSCAIVWSIIVWLTPLSLQSTTCPPAGRPVEHQSVRCAIRRAGRWSSRQGKGTERGGRRHEANTRQHGTSTYIRRYGVCIHQPRNVAIIILYMYTRAFIHQSTL